MADGMVSLEHDDEDMLDFESPIPMPVKPDFPCGLCITLTEAEFRKLKLDPKQAEVGNYVEFEARARITHVSHSDGEASDEHHRVELQIEKMAVETTYEDKEED